MLATGKVSVICYCEHILSIGAYPLTFLSEFGHTTDLPDSSRRRNFKMSDKCKQLLIISEFGKQIISFHKDLMSDYYVQCTRPCPIIHSKGNTHLTGKEMCRETHGEHNRENNSLGAMKYSLIEVAFETGSWRMSRISIEGHRSKGDSSGRSQNSKGRKLNGMFREW